VGVEPKGDGKVRPTDAGRTEQQDILARCEMPPGRQLADHGSIDGSSAFVGLPSVHRARGIGVPHVTATAFGAS
jgi:hypothetical protein